MCVCGASQNGNISLIFFSKNLLLTECVKILAVMYSYSHAFANIHAVAVADKSFAKLIVIALAHCREYSRKKIRKNPVVGCSLLDLLFHKKVFLLNLKKN